MLLSGRFVAVIVFVIAVCLCLTVCVVPQAMAQAVETSSDCHTETDQEQADHSESCCSVAAVLPEQATLFKPFLFESCEPKPNEVAESAGLTVSNLAARDPVRISASILILRI
jgi:hypothetical protein